ncbi:MAG TPA: N-acetylmuramoyl-L-alanine amidase [Geobacteraceae bacterium]|nr:N-acetylmuramoyl-L-alanine amidase [Geobacteraceae bacterium]
MKIKNHRLLKDDGTPLPFRQSPNMGDKVQHRFLVMHFTASRSAAESVEWLTNRKAKASAHVVIGRDGSITQLVPFDRVAWHAGASSWEGLDGMNSYSLGIELDNAGRLTLHGDRWRAWFGGDYDDGEVVQAVHKHETTLCGWHDYAPAQIDAALQVAGLLVDKYGLRDVVGHEDIAPLRKCDPGPAFPMASFRSRLMGRLEDSLPQYRTTTELNIRTGPGAQYTPLPGSPLLLGTSVQLITTAGAWWKVDVQGGAGVPADLEGWVNSRYLERV